MSSTISSTSSRSRSHLVAIEPALKAYALGYAADALPALLKALVRFFTLEVKRLNTIRRNAKGKGRAEGHRKDGQSEKSPPAAASAGLRAADLLPTLFAIPTLLKALLKALTESLGLSRSKSSNGFGYQLGMAPACALAILGWSLLNNTLNLLLPSRQAAHSGFKLGSTRELSRRHSEIVTCFLSSTIAATGALTLLQLSNQQNQSALPLASPSPVIGSDSREELFSSDSNNSSNEMQAHHRNRKFLGFLSSPTSSYFSSSSTSILDKTGPKNRASERLAPQITPTPLAPGGHFLARLTSLTLGPFSNPGSPSNSRPQTPQLPSSGKEGNPRKMIPSRSHETIISQPVARRGIEGLKEGELAAQLEDALIKQQEQEAREGDLVSRDASETSSIGSRSNSPVSLKQVPSSSEVQPASSASVPTSSTSNANQFKSKPRPSMTIDLTLFALVRGMDTLVRAAPLIASALARSNTRSTPSSSAKSQVKAKETLRSSMLGRVAAGLASQAEGLTFVVCCAQIMWAWFYHPERLPPSYVRWISGLASMDHRLLTLLRALRNDKPYHWKYQDPTSDARECRDLAEALGYPARWGDARHLHNTKKDAQKAFAQAEIERTKRSSEFEKEKNLESGLTIETDPAISEGSSRKVQAQSDYILSGASGPRGKGQMGGLPCEIVHCGVGGSSCLANAALRWLKGFKVCMGIYVPVHLLPRLIFGFQGFVNNPGDNLFKVLKGSARSASFLATYIASIWFMVCFGRTLVLPRLFDMPFNFWDSGLGPALGSFACGFAVFIEEKRKRAEMALYVAPRALFAVAESLKPGWLSEAKKSALWTERFLFGIAVGIVMTSGKFRPDLLRGITSLMAWVVKDAASKNKSIKVSS